MVQNICEKGKFFSVMKNDRDLMVVRVKNDEKHLG